MVDAVTAASHGHPIGLVILGDGNKRSRIVRGIFGNPHIRMLEPERDRICFATILASADALIHGCEAETFCLAAAEARASGIPVIVPDRGGAADHAADGAGITYAAGSAEAAAEAIIRFIDGPSLPLGRVPVSRTMRDHFSGLFADYAGIATHRHALA